MTKSRQTDAKTSSLSSLISQIHPGFYAFHVFSQDPNGRRFALCQAALQALGQSKPQILKIYHLYLYVLIVYIYTHTYIYTQYVCLFDGISLSNLMDDWMALDTQKGQIHSTEPLGSGFLVVLSENSLHFLLAAARLGGWVRILCPLKSRKSLKLNGFTMVHLYTRRILNTQFFVQLVPDFAASGFSNRP